MIGAFLSQRDSSRCSLGRCSITFDDSPNNYYLYRPSDDAQLKSFEISKEPYPARDLVAIITSRSWTISLEIFSEVRIHARAWGPKEDSVVTLTRAAGKSSLIFLRPDDIFQIGDVILQVLPEKAISEVQVTSSGYIEAVADRMDNIYNKEMKSGNQIDALLPENSSTPRNQSSDAGSVHEFDTTIMETPAASRHCNPDMSDSSLMLTCVEHGMKDDGGKSEAALLSTRGVSKLEDKVPLQVYPTTTKNNDDKIRKSHLDGPGLEHPEDIASLSEEKVISDTNVTKNSNNGGFALSGCLTELLQHEENVNDLACGFDRNPEEPIKTPYGKGIALSPTSERTERGPRKRKRPREESQARVESLNHVAISPAAKSKSIINQPLKGGSEAWKQNTKNSPVKPVRDLSEPPPSASARSRRSVKLREHSPLSSSSSMTGEPRRVFFSSSTTIDRTSKRLTFLERNGVTKVNSVEECDILCVAKGELKKTGSLVLAVIFGKEVVTDDWISTSISKGELLDPQSFLARDPSKEAEWKIDLREAIERGKRGIKPFLNSSFFFTSAAKKGLGKVFQDLKAIAMHAGAKSVQVSIPKKPSQMADKSQIFIIAAAQDDCELPALEEAGWRSFFNKDIITLSVLRGTVDVEGNEFLIQPQIEFNQPSSNKRMKRSSVKSR